MMFITWLLMMIIMIRIELMSSILLIKKVIMDIKHIGTGQLLIGTSAMWNYSCSLLLYAQKSAIPGVSYSTWRVVQYRTAK